MGFKRWISWEFVGVKRGFNGIEFAKLVNMTPRTVGVMDVHDRYDVSWGL